LKELGYCCDAPVNGLFCEVSSAEIVAKLLEPQLHCNDSEKDLSVMVDKFEVVGQRKQQTTIEQSK
jgi:saccharopine dehydrogenase-like NADP-dependent oxidoreductase